VLCTFLLVQTFIPGGAGNETTFEDALSTAEGLSGSSSFFTRKSVSSREIVGSVVPLAPAEVEGVRVWRAAMADGQQARKLCAQSGDKRVQSAWDVIIDPTNKERITLVSSPSASSYLLPVTSASGQSPHTRQLPILLLAKRLSRTVQDGQTLRECCALVSSVCLCPIHDHSLPMPLPPIWINTPKRLLS
jgi:hypothetical protein